MTLPLLETPPDWSNPNWADRASACASLLFCHGYISMSQNDKIHQKLEAQFAQAIEARRAETGTGSVVDESAVGKADAPEDSIDTSSATKAAEALR